jgi:hemolysin activation/secretion protein
MARLCIFVLLLTGIGFAIEIARAQTIPTINPVPQGSPIPRILPVTPPELRPGGIVSPPAAPNKALGNQTVRVTSIVVEGVTAYPPAEIIKLARGLTGQSVPLRRIDAARLAILERYRSDGYVFTAVSAILDAAGRLRFVATEGHIVTVSLKGDIGPAGRQVLRFLDRLTEERVIDAATLERYLLLAQDVPGVSLHAVLEPVAGRPGALKLIAAVERKPVSGLVTADNRAFYETGPIESLAVVDLNSFTQYGEKTEISYYHAFPDSENFAEVSNEMFIGSSGLKLRVYGGAGPTVPTGGLSGLGYSGMTSVFGLAASYPVIRSRQRTLNVYASFDGLDSDNSILSNLQQSEDDVRAVRLGKEYAVSDLLLGSYRPAISVLRVRFSQGVPIFGATADGNTPTSARLNEQASFSKIDFEASRTQTLFSPWKGASVALFGLLTGQWTPDVLPPSEEFYLGGARFTRGYYSGQVQGDKALAATGELQLNTSIPINLFGKSLEIPVLWYLFYDWGETWQNQAADFGTTISSAGGGLRCPLTGNIEVDLEALARFNRFPTGAGSGVSPLTEGALYWRVLSRF